MYMRINIYLITQQYQKKQKRNDLHSESTSRQISGENLYKNLPQIAKSETELALTELQLLCSCSYRSVKTASDLGLTVFQFTKAIAQLPYKQQKQEKHQLTDFYASGDNKDCVKVDKDGNGLSRLWNQVLTTFPLARLETADAISSNYPTVASLMQAYDNCTSVEEAEKLLQNIPIRRGVGPLTGVRRIGPELSKKVFNFFTSLDGDLII